MTDPLIEQLEQNGLKPSYQRVRILGYLLEDESHSTAEDVYQALKQEIPTLALATVYNTLNAFAEKGIIRTLATGRFGTRYDFASDPHAHFICTECRRIYDFHPTFSCDTPELDGFLVQSEDIVLKGICKDCLSK
ncbi:MAG: Fur family transcriptional regulator [Acidobacteriota bacterium]|jgi:Fur family peroxide stress response transcriptional regulator|nr:Fur family transcriptional regulator [Acidobacteriota bacterium]NLT32389.1 transcriptional repressor [Acidobacteriota bacterium]